MDAEAKAKVTLETTIDHLRVLGADINHPADIVDIHAPASGVITDQQVTNAAGVQGLAGPNPFTISDLSHVWVLCDVYENDLPFVRLGEYADIHLNAYPDLVLKGRIGNISPILDPNLRTAKVRLEVQNSGLLRLGMFVTATFYGMKKEVHAIVPAGAVADNCSLKNSVRPIELLVGHPPEPVEGFWLRSWWFDKLTTNGLMDYLG